MSLGAGRLLHGVRAVEDRRTLSLLADRRVCCDVCPVRAPHNMDYPPKGWPESPRIVVKYAPCASNGPDGLCALQTSNVLLNVVGCGSLADHPLPELLAAGRPRSADTAMLLHHPTAPRSGCRSALWLPLGHSGCPRNGRSRHRRWHGVVAWAMARAVAWASTA